MYSYSKKPTLLVFLFVFFMQTNCLIAADTLSIKKGEPKTEVLVGHYVEVLKDPKGDFSFNDVHTGKYKNDFSNVTLSYPYDLNQEDPRAFYWIKFYVNAADSHRNGYILEMSNPYIYYAELYAPSANGYYAIHSGMSFPFEERPFWHKKIAFSIPLKQTSQVYYLKCQSSSLTAFSFGIETTEHFCSRLFEEYYINGLFYGILLLVISYNILLYISVREKIYLRYTLYVISCGLFMLSSDGFGFQLFWADYPWLNKYIGKFTSVLMLLGFYGYSLSILNTKGRYPFFERAVLWMVGGYVCYFVLALAYPHLKTSVGDLLYNLPFFLIFIIGCRIAFAGYKPAMYFSLGYFFILVSFIYNLLEKYDLIYIDFMSNFGFQLGVAIEVLLFSIALSERIRLIKQEKENALREKNRAQENVIEQLKVNELLKDKVNRELEDKVIQRTLEIKAVNQELENANEQLKIQAEEISRWNIKLDIANHHLNKNIQEIAVSRVLHKAVDFEEFSAKFPNENTCLRFLNDLKWHNGYLCSKCGHDHYCNGKSPFSRKCTRCTYEESILKNTIFEGSKLPVNQLFSMLFLTYISQDKITASELSRTLDIRVKTCWGFHKKVSERMQKNAINSGDGWDALILNNNSQTD